ncbi:tubulin polyglutamylase ttll6-like [Condylostylus longicornis]|uniref:tubulin polyglutamylase ttll6-like n=1 Tax=Condylostylus longicornis TaxID=2530218 RepID=UPI00244E3A75|nr:tubulin polyglutamylase ttll6-like [Condylostylus longicornis]
MEENEEFSSDDSNFSDESESSISSTSTTTYSSEIIKSKNILLPIILKVDKSEPDIGKSLQKDIAISSSQTEINNEKLEKNQKSSRKGKKNRLSICITQTRYKIVGKVAKSVGWRLVRFSGHWNILWVDTDPGIETYKDMKRYQKVNHFPGMQEICRKDLLARNLGRLLKIYPEEYDFYPKTWCFPADYMEAVNFSREHRNKTFILKPDAGAQGRGIFLTKNIKENVKPTERLICQLYINKPLLIDGFKFDLRVYTLITTVDPLRIFVYNEGLVRMATSKYKEPNEFNVSDLFMHLTNYSVNKRSDNFSHDAQLGSKRKFSSLHRNLIKEGYDIDTLWRNIDDTIIKTILSSWPMLKHNYRACFPCHDVMQACFEILGFDILVDRNLKPYILEVNQSPSFYTDEPVDYEVKEALIRDTLNLLNISLIDKTKIINEDKKRIKMRLLTNRRRTKLKSSYSKDHLTNPSIISPLGQQIAWEESHLGGFRRIMPAQTDTHKYSHLIQSQNQASIYSETAASKRREEAAKQMRIAILEKQRRNQAMILTNKSLKRRIGAPSLRKSKENCALKKLWSNGGVVNDFEERERRRLLLEREEMLRQSGVLNLILETFHKMRILSDSDHLKFSEEIKGLNQKVDQGHHKLNLQNLTCYTATVNDFTTWPKNSFKNHESYLTSL